MNSASGRHCHQNTENHLGTQNFLYLIEKRNVNLYFETYLSIFTDLTSPNFVWKLLPNTVFSKFPTGWVEIKVGDINEKIAPAVMRKTKSRDPVNPVAIVISWEEARKPLYTWAGLSSPDILTIHHLHCTEYQKWQNRWDEEGSSFSQSHFSGKFFLGFFCWLLVGLFNSRRDTGWMSACPISTLFRLE